MKRSEIFESYAKIAEEKGLVKKASTESNKKDLEETGRADSLSITDITKLYGVKPDAPKEMQYERNIVEKAHPESVVFFRSYDKLNSLVENINERQDILLHIVNKESPDGQLTNRKYAEKELTLALVRVGNDMDNRGQDDLRALADTCLTQVVPTMKKRALLQVIIPIIVGIAAAVYAKQHLPFHSDGWNRDYPKAIAELNDLIGSSKGWGVGYNYRPEFITQCNEIKEKLDHMNSVVETLSDALDNLQYPRTSEQLKELSNDPKTKDTLSVFQNFQNELKTFYPYFKQVVIEFSSEDFKQRQIQDEGFMQQMVDSTGFLHGGKGFIADNFDDVVHALQALFKDLDGMLQSVVNSSAIAKRYADKLQTAQSEDSSSTQAPTPHEAAPPETAELPPVGEAQQNRIQQESENLSKELEGYSWEDLYGRGT